MTLDDTALTEVSLAARESTPPARHAIAWPATLVFVGVHVAAALGVARVGASWRLVALALATYAVRMFGLTAGFHRYFAHRAFKTSRAMQFALAFIATTSVQQGVLWWASHHRVHHKYADRPGDLHSRTLGGFLWAHVGWTLVHDYDVPSWDEIRDFARFPELRLLNRFHIVAPIALSLALYASGGAPALVWGFFVSTVALWHGTFSLNSVAHWLGRRRYATADDSRNNLAVALITMGEGWHNNHHYYPRSARQGFRAWEIDVTYYAIRALAAVGLVWDVRGVPASVLAADAPARPGARV